MKIGIITITNGQNYGNRLQNYALQEVLKAFGHTPETIWNDTGAWENLGIYSRLKYWVKKNLRIKYSPRIDRVIRFTNFNRKYISWSRDKVSASKIPDGLSDKYDCFICGSDQIWNLYYERTSRVDFLSFVRSEQKIAYAASLGVYKIQPEHEKLFADYLSDFKEISVRESDGANILRDILKRDVPVMPDPTALLKKEQWDALKKKPEKLAEDEKYILTYFLGENKAALDFAERISRERGCRLISLEDCYTDGWENPYFITMDPCEFLWLVEHAECILTDSFHGCMFSIIYNKKFLVYRRDLTISPDPRVTQLLKSYRLEGHMACEDEKINLSILDETVCVDDILNAERHRGIDFLRRSLCDEEKN